MKAWLLTDTKGIESYELNEVEDPEPGPDEIRVKISHSALNHLDLWVSQGLPAPTHLPHIGGADGAGRVDAVGDNVSGFEIGDEVIIDPSFSCGHCSFCRNDEVVYCDSFQILVSTGPELFTEKIVIPTINAVRKPSAMPWEIAGSFGLRHRHRLAHDGASGAEAGADPARSRRRRRRLGGGDAARPCHADQGLRHIPVTGQDRLGHRTRSSGRLSVRHRVRRRDGIARGGGRHHRERGPATIRQSMRAAKKGGKIAICGATSGAKMDLTLPALFFRQLELIGSSMANYSQFARPRPGSGPPAPRHRWARCSISQTCRPH